MTAQQPDDDILALARAVGVVAEPIHLAFRGMLTDDAIDAAMSNFARAIAFVEGDTYEDLDPDAPLADVVDLHVIHCVLCHDTGIYETEWSILTGGPTEVTCPACNGGEL